LILKYNRISTKFWTDEKVLQWDNETRILALYLLTCPHKTTEGLFRLPKQYICADLAWSLEGLAKPFNKLLEDGFIKYDNTVNVILLCNALKYQSPDNPNQEKSAISLLKELPKTDLLYQFIRQAERFSERFYQRLVEQFGKPLALSLALSLTPTLTLTPNKDNNIRQDSKNDLLVAEEKKELPDEKKSDSSFHVKSSSEKKSIQNQEIDSNQQSEEKKTKEKQNDSPEKINTSGEKKSTAGNPNTNTAASETEKNNLEKNNKPEDMSDQNPNSKQSPTVEFDRNSKPYQACCFLIDGIIDNNSRARVPNKDPTDKLMQKWCKELDRLHRLGPLGAKKAQNKGYSWQEICQLINWSQQHHFWKSNILSAATLRKQVIKLENQLEQSPANKGKERMELLQEVYLDAQEDDEKGGFDPL